MYSGVPSRTTHVNREPPTARPRCCNSKTLFLPPSIHPSLPPSIHPFTPSAAVAQILPRPSVRLARFTT